jgi:opacity protein-like surface antigen
MRADSIARVEQMRRDSIAAVERARADSIAAVEAARAAAEKARLDSIAAVEAARRAEQLRLEQLRNRYLFNQSGWYLGLAAGSAMPQDDFDEVGYGSGWNITVPIGYQRLNQALGFRLDLGYSEFGGGTFSPASPLRPVISNSDPSVFSASMNLTLRFPFTKSRTSAIYGLGGGGYYQFNDIGFQSGLAGIMGEDPVPGGEFDNSVGKFGWNVGAGVEFGVGLAAIFLESRFENVIGKDDDDFTNFYGARSDNVRWVPIILGVKFY